MDEADLAIVILTYNEGKHIARCLNSLVAVSKEIVIVDSFSTDNTLAIIEKYGERVRLFQRVWKNYADQFQWALDNINFSSNWIMRLDADEYLEPDLIDEIPFILKSSDQSINGLYIKRKYFYKDEWIRFGGVYPLYLLRIWRKGQGRIEQRWMDEHIVINRPNIRTLKGHIVDNNLNDMKWWISKHIKYADREVVDLLNTKYSFFQKDEQVKNSGGLQARMKRIIKEKVYLNISPSLRSFIYFLYRYFLRLGFLDGSKGWDYHFMQGFWYRSYVDIRYKELLSLINHVDDNKLKVELLAKETGLNLREDQE